MSNNDSLRYGLSMYLEIPYSDTKRIDWYDPDSSPQVLHDFLKKYNTTAIGRDVKANGFPSFIGSKCFGLVFITHKEGCHYSMVEIEGDNITYLDQPTDPWEKKQADILLDESEIDYLLLLFKGEDDE